MAALGELDDLFARCAIPLMRRAGLRLGGCVDLELGCLIDPTPAGLTLQPQHPRHRGAGELLPVTPRPLHHPCATELGNAAMSLQALMVVPGHATPEPGPYRSTSAGDPRPCRL